MMKQKELPKFPHCCLDEKHYCERDAWRSEFAAQLESLKAMCDAHIRKNLKNPPSNLAEMYFYAKREVIKDILEAFK